jgi:hypothetical protein
MTYGDLEVAKVVWGSRGLARTSIFVIPCDTLQPGLDWQWVQELDAIAHVFGQRLPGKALRMIGVAIPFKSRYRNQHP